MAQIYVSGYLADNVTPFSYEIRPNDVQMSVKNYTEDIVALDGTFHRFHRGYKRQFKLTFTNVQSGIASKLYDIFVIPNQLDFQTIESGKYTVFTEANSFTSSLSATTVSLKKDNAGNPIKLYTLALNLVEK